MKKILLLIFVSIFFMGCDLSTEELLKETFSKEHKPFIEYKIPDKKTATIIENGILETETKKYGLEPNTSAHLVQLTKIGTYGTGVVKIMGEITKENFEKINKNRADYNKIASQIVVYDCNFDYSYKTGQIFWKSDYPYQD